MALLEQEKTKRGLTVSDVMSIEQSIEQKRSRRQGLDEQLSRGLQAELALHEEEEAELGHYLSERDGAALSGYVACEQKRLLSKYGHLRQW
ncbi:MAG: hypothetical protein ROO73_04825 [Roseivirga sp.]